MNTGLIFSSFDPVHIGHVSMAMWAINNGICDCVFFVPLNHGEANFYDRMDMLDQVCEWKPDKINAPIKRLSLLPWQTKTFTSILQEIEARRSEGEEFIILIPKDVYAKVEMFEPLKKYRIVVVDNPIKIHSRDIRTMVKEGKNPIPYIYPSTQETIKEQKLYRK
jgi:cytidylyltransferase